MIEGVLLGYGLGMITFFGLSLLAFMGSPISSAMNFLDGIYLITGLVAGLLALAWYYIKTEDRQQQIAN